MELISKIKNNIQRRSTLKHKLYKFLQKHSKVNENSPIVIIWDFGGFGDVLKKNAIVSAALNVRGYKTHFIICDGTPEACIQRGVEQNQMPSDWEKSCPKCIYRMKYNANQYSAEYTFGGEYISEKEKNEFKEISKNISIGDIFNYVFMDVEIGKLAWSSLVRYMKGYVIVPEDLKQKDEKIYRKYFYAGLVNTFIADKVLEKYKPVSVYCSHGVYVDYAPVVLLAFFKKLSILCWSSGYKILLHYFTIPKTANKLEFRGILDDAWKKRNEKSLTETENKILDNYFIERYNKGKRIDFLNLSLPESKEELKKKLGINDDKKIVCMFCHVAWDLAFDLTEMFFDNANDWFDTTFKIMSENKNVNWLIRVHPGEKGSGSLYSLDDYIKEKFNIIPENIKIIWSDSEINSYGLYQMIDAGITLFGTTGAELPLLGKNVISGGKSYFSNKGFTIDPVSKEDYIKILMNIHDTKPLTNEQIDTARRYAYSYFIERQIPINLINKSEGHFGNIDPDKIKDLLPGKDLIMDAICESIIKGNDVILNEDMIRQVDGSLDERFLPL